MANHETVDYNRDTYGSRIRYFRTARGLTQPQLAEQIGVGKNAISNWEAGRARPDLNTLPRLCAALGISIAKFFGVTAASGPEMEPSEKQLLRSYRRLTSDHRTLVHDMIGSMLRLQQNERRTLLSENLRRLFHSDLKAAAGPGATLDDGRTGRSVTVRINSRTQRADMIITVTGDSMEPTCHDGDDLLVERTSSIAPGEIGIFVADGDGFVKEYQKDGLHSHNPAYPVLRFGEDDNVRCIGRVLGALSPEDLPPAEEAEEFEALFPEGGEEI